MPRKISIAAALLALQVSAFLTPTVTASTIDFSTCRIGAMPASVPAECASVEVPFTYGLVPENTQTSGKAQPKTITLSVAKIPARANQVSDDPLTLLAGGPGQSAAEAWPQIQNAFYPILANRDVYLIDQRGTGKSARMDCPSLPADNELNRDLKAVQQAATQCYEEQPLATQWFTTSVAVRDLDTVREALGIKQWNLYGVSYGTRVALHYLRRYPQHTRSVIIDAVVAPQKPIGPEIPLHAQQSLDALFERCENDTACAEAFPDLADKTDSLFDSLKNNPRNVQFENISLGALDTMELSDQHLAGTVRLLSYSSYGTSILPSMLYDAATDNNLAPFARQTHMQISQLDGSMATGMHSAVICTEDAPFIESVADRSALQNTYLGDFLVDAMSATCKPWPAGVIDDDFHEPVSSEVPVLALSGAVDPITPPEYAELAIQSLSNSHHIVNPHQGHTQAPLGCIPALMSQFVDTPDPRNLATDCLKRLSPPALFIDANGPMP
jgi:pimeloyl-ACP methyl ester carboxylesterase